MCFEVVTDPVRSTKCNHVYCRDCITSLLEQGIGTETCPSPSCSREFTIKQLSDIPATATAAATAQSATSAAASKVAAVIFETKVNWLMGQLQKLISEDSTTKVLVRRLRPRNTSPFHPHFQFYGFTYSCIPPLQIS